MLRSPAILLPAVQQVSFDSSTQHPSMADGATFKLSGNTLNGAKESVIWKTNTEWKPSYVNQ